MKKTGLFFLSLLISLTLSAREFNVLEVSNNSEGELYDYKLVLKMNSENKIKQFYVDSYLKGNHKAGIQKRDVRHIGNLKNGIVLVKRRGYNLAILRSNSFISDVGGELELFYLNRGSLTGPPGGKYLKRDLTLLSHGNQWQLYTENNDDVHYADFKVNKILGIEVGIADIQFR